MAAPAAAVPLVDWAQEGAALPAEPFADGDLGRPGDELGAWVETTSERLAGGDRDAARAAVGQLVGLAAGSGAVATAVRGLLVDRLWSRALGLGGGPALRSGVDAGGAGRDSTIGRWLVAPPGAAANLVLLLSPAGEARTWTVAGLGNLPSQPLVGLAGLELVDLTGLAGAGEAAATSAAAAAAIAGAAQLLDAAIELGISIGFAERIGRYAAVVDGTDALEPFATERLGEAFAAFGALSEGLREAVAGWPDPAAPAAGAEDWRLRVAAHRALGLRVHERLLSELFEVAGARATSGRLGLDTALRDLAARRAAFPGPALPRPATQ